MTKKSQYSMFHCDKKSNIQRVKKRCLNIFCLFTFTLFFFGSGLNAQTNFIPGVIRIIVHDTLLIPTDSRPSNNSQFTEILNDFNISNISKPLHFAKTVELRRLYQLQTEYNEDSLAIALLRLQEISDLFLSIEKCPIPVNLYSPSDYMWSVIDVVPGLQVGDDYGNIHHGKYIYLTNTLNEDASFNIDFTCRDNSLNLINDAELTLNFQATDWSEIQKYFINNDDFEVLRENIVRIVNPNAHISNLLLEANSRIPLFIGVNFLSDKLNESSPDVISYLFDIHQFYTDSNVYVGGDHFSINRYKRVPFDANAGENRIIDAGESVELSAIQINEVALYNWYDENNNLISTGKDLSIDPIITTKYRLEVITSDGFKDYDEVEVKVNPSLIVSISPNPASNLFKLITLPKTRTLHTL